jgi:alginate O-acetyltransferase complex protein AlgI
MLFNSIEFAIFLPIVFALYWGVFNKNLKAQNAFIIFASYFFYGWWDWRFLYLLIFSSAFTYFIALQIARSENQTTRKRLLLLSVGADLGILGFFKYFDFFAEGFASLFSLFGREADFVALDIILPLGISFYTFQTIGYSIDVYRRKVPPATDILAFFAYISFFPQLIAGPIERASQLLPQFKAERKFDYAKATDGLRRILWGLFKKIVIADNCAVIVNRIFADDSGFTGSTYFWGAFLFAFQIYGDFSGYSDIAIGTGKLFGLDLVRNFKYPFFARNIPDFWRRWHISLSTWFRDYVYFSLGGRSRLKIVRNIFIIFTLIGLWHGANWTFITWGVLNAVLFLPFLLPVFSGKKRRKKSAGSSTFIKYVREYFIYALSLILLILSAVLFRSENLTQSYFIYSRIFSESIFTVPYKLSYKIIVFILLFMCAERLQIKKEHVLKFDETRLPMPVRYLIYFMIVFFIVFFAGNTKEFIYFQF